MERNEWIAFRERLPAHADADSRGYVMLQESNGNQRQGLWDWTRTAESWRVNGFTHWRGLTPSETAARERSGERE